MSKRERIVTVILVGVFLCYIVLLVKILFLSRFSLSELLNGQRIVNRSMNIIPFHSITEYLFGGNATVKRFAFGNVVGNIALFVPLGVYLPLLRKEKRVAANLFVVLIVSFLAEVVQWVLGIGAADVDDIILNCLGGWIGILLYQFSRFVFRDEKKVRAVIAILSAIIGLPVVYYFLFVVRMRF